MADEYDCLVVIRCFSHQSVEDLSSAFGECCCCFIYYEHFRIMCHRLGDLDQLALFHVVGSCHSCGIDIRNTDVFQSFLGFFDHLSLGNDRTGFESVVVTDEDVFRY